MAIAEMVERDRYDILVTELIESVQSARPTPENPNDHVMSALVSAAVLHGISAHLNGSLGEELAAAANAFAIELLDEHCGTPPGPHPHGPGPRLIASLAAVVAILPAQSRFGASLRGIAFGAAARTFGLSNAGSDPMPA